jgi:hypothetical protein
MNVNILPDKLRWIEASRMKKTTEAPYQYKPFWQAVECCNWSIDLIG